MEKRFRDISAVIDVAAQDKLRLKEFMKQELAFYNALVEGLGPRARTFPKTILAIHKDWEVLWEDIAHEGKSIKMWERAKPDAELPGYLEKHRRMLLEKDSQGRRFLDDKMLNIMSLAATPAIIHPLVRKGMARLILEFYKDQSAILVNRNDDAMGEEDIYSKPVDLLVRQDMVTKRHLQLPRQALNDVRWIESQDLTEIYHPYSELPIKVLGKNLENDNHWNWLMIHQQPGVEVVPSDPWHIDIGHRQEPYQIKYQDVTQPKTGRIFATMKRRAD